MSKDEAFFFVYEGLDNTIRYKDLLTWIDDYCKFYARKRAHRLIDTSIYARFLSSAYLYGFVKQAEYHFNQENEKVATRVSFAAVSQKQALFGMQSNDDLLSGLQEISEHQRLLSVVRWNNEFLVPYGEHAEAKSSRLWTVLRLQKMQKVMVRLREAVLNEDWPEAGRLIGRLPALKIVISGVSKTIREQLDDTSRIITIALSPFYVSIFRVGVQRLMRHPISRDVVIKSAAELMLHLVEGDYKREQTGRGYQTRNLGLLYATEILIFCIANSLHQEAKDLITGIAALPLNTRDMQYSVVTRAYEALLNYDCWRRTGEASQSDLLAIADSLLAALNEVPFGEEKLFLVALIHFLTTLVLPDMLYDAAKSCCTRTSILVGHCYRCLNAFGNTGTAEKLLGLFSFSSDLSPSDPIWLEWIQSRLINLQTYEISETFLAQACELLCSFLDYGEHRNNERAWCFLWVCVQRINDRHFLGHLWKRRKSWWPKFQTVPMSQPSIDCRNQVIVWFFNVSLENAVQ